MSNITPPLRSGMTAIAAVIALSSTPLLAQATDGAAGQASPIVIAPPAPDVTAAPAAPVAVEQSAAAAPAPAMRTMSTPVVHTSEAPAETAPAAPRRAPVEPKVTKAAAPVATARATAPAKPAAPVEVTPAAAPSVPAAKVAAVPAPAPVAATAAPVAAVTTVQTAQRSTLDEDAAPIAGAVGLGLIVIGGVAFAIRRRKRTDDEEELVLEPASMEAAPVVATPAVAVAAPVARTSRVKALPNGFDLSHFGRHAQAAYRGPTKDNPSFSLKRRLSRASFFDQREREAAAAAAVAKTAHPETVAASAKAPVASDDRQVTIRMAPARRAKTGKLALAFKKK